MSIFLLPKRQRLLHYRASLLIIVYIETTSLTLKKLRKQGTLNERESYVRLALYFFNIHRT
jgi:hypothetical protein